MGGTSYSADFTKSRLASHKAAGTSPFTHDADIKSGKTDKKVHKNLDPSTKNKAGKNVRESFDSPEHPNSRPIVVLFDVTGSMSHTPEVFVEKLDKLMSALVKKGYVDDPQILFGAIGDATCDKVPLQIGQFESGNEMDDVLTKIVLEGGGGGHITESYELGMYYLARHTSLDSINKRNQKGYCFILGDETPYKEVRKSQVELLIGDTLETNIETKDILEELREKFEVFWIIPAQTSNFENDDVIDPLRKMFNQHLLKLTNPEDVCELIVSTIGVSEGLDLNDIKSDLKDIGSDTVSINRATDALVLYKSSALTKSRGAVASSKIPKTAGKDVVERV